MPLKKGQIPKVAGFKGLIYTHYYIYIIDNKQRSTV